MHPRCPTKGEDYFDCAIYEKKNQLKAKSFSYGILSY